MGASRERRRLWSAVIVDGVFVVGFLASAVLALALAFPVWVRAGRDGPEAVAQLAPASSDAGEVVAWSRSMIWPDISATWADGEVTRYTASWAFGLPLILVVLWLTVVVLQARAGEAPTGGTGDPSHGDTQPIPTVPR